MSLMIPDYPDPQGAPGEAIPAAHWQIDLIEIGGTSELVKADPDLSRIRGRCAATVHRSMAAAQSEGPGEGKRVETEEFAFGDGVIAPYAEALAAGMAGDPLHVKLLQAQQLLKEWVEEQVIAHKYPNATVNPA